MKKKQREVWNGLGTQRLNNQNFITLVTLFFMVIMVYEFPWIQDKLFTDDLKQSVLQPCLWAFKSNRRCCRMLQTAVDKQPDRTALSQGWVGSAWESLVGEPQLLFPPFPHYNAAFLGKHGWEKEQMFRSASSGSEFPSKSPHLQFYRKNKIKRR